MPPKQGSTRCERISRCWSKRLKPNDTSRAFTCIAARPQRFPKRLGDSELFGCQWSYSRISRRAPVGSLGERIDNPKRHHALVFVRLAHDRRFVAAVLLLFVLVLFVFVRISGRHRVAHSHEGTPADQPGGKVLGNVWGHVVAPRV